MLTLWWCWLNRSHCSLSQSKTGIAQQFVEVFSLHFGDHDFKDREAKQEASGRTLDLRSILSLEQSISPAKFLNCHHSTTYDVNITRNLQKGDNENVCLHLWELWMPHLQSLSTVADRRDNTNAVKMLHQMSVCVVVVALGLVLNCRLSINLRRSKNGNGNYCLTGKLLPKKKKKKKTAGNNFWPNCRRSIQQSLVRCSLHKVLDTMGMSPFGFCRWQLVCTNSG